MKIKTIAYFLLTIGVLYFVAKLIIRTEGFVEGHGGGGGGGGGHGGGGHGGGGWGPHGGGWGPGRGGRPGPWVWGGNGGTWGGYNGYGWGWGWDLLPPQSQTVVYKPKKPAQNMGPVYFFMGIIAAILGGIFTIMLVK